MKKYETAYDGSDEYELELDPAGAIQWRNGNDLFFWEGMEIGWRGLRNQRSLLQAGIRYEDGLEPDESDDGRLDGRRRETCRSMERGTCAWIRRWASAPRR